MNQAANYRDAQPAPLAPDEVSAAGPEPDPESDIEWRSQFVNAEGHGQRLDKVLVGMAPEFSRNHLQGLIERGHVQVDGQAATTASRRVRAGQQVQVELVPTAQSLAFRAEPVPVNAVYEDEHVLVIDKPAGLVVHPAAGNWSGTLLNGLLARSAGASLLPRAGIVHRLDKDTSGLMVVGKTLEAVTALSRAIAAREVRREYLALAHGELPPGERSVEAPIGRDPASRVRMAVVAGGRTSRTDVSTLAVHGGFSAVRCMLHTGRTHQIRVHMAHIGAPLVADAVYGGSAALGMQRQALHAWRLAFSHPVTAASLEFVSSLPPEMLAAWRRVCTEPLLN